MVLYAAYDTNRRAAAPLLASYNATARVLKALPRPLRDRGPVRRARAFSEVASRARPTHDRPDFAIAEVPVDGDLVPVQERPEPMSPFATLLHFDKPSVTVVQPQVLDWHNARDIPAEHGPFGLDEYVEHVMTALRRLAPGTHVVAVCQPAVPVLAAVALLAQDDDAAQPASMTLIAGRIDTSINPNRINLLACSTPLRSFQRRVVTTVPRRYAGAGRRVYPGFMQLAAFMSMNRKRHLQAHVGLYRDLVAGEDERAATTRAFYDEYGAVMDVPAEFYLETVGRIFQEHLLARGELTWCGRAVDPAAITRTALLTVEGENDDICSPGQTRAAHDLCTGIPAERKAHHLQPGVGHYGVFSGSRWETEIYPVVKEFVGKNAAVPTK